MCGRYTAPYEGHDLEIRFELSRNVGHFEKTWNASPGQMLPVVTKNSPKQGLLMKCMKWGFIAPWEKDFTKAKFKPINARDDKLSGGFFRQAFSTTRCLIPAGCLKNAQTRHHPLCWGAARSYPRRSLSVYTGQILAASGHHDLGTGLDYQRCMI